MVFVHHRGAAGKVGGGDADHGVGDFVGVGGLGFLHRLGPHVEADIGGFHGVVGYPFAVTDVVVPLLDEAVVLVGVDALEIIPGGQVADQRAGVDTGQFLLADGERHHRDVGGVDALVAQFLVERYVGVTIDGGHHRGFLALAAEFLDAGNDGLPVGVTERGVVDHDVLVSHAFAFQVGFEDLVGGARINVIGARQHEAFGAQLVDQIVHRRNGLLIRCRAGVEHVLGGLLAFVLNRIEQ